MIKLKPTGDGHHIGSVKWNQSANGGTIDHVLIEVLHFWDLRHVSYGTWNVNILRQLPNYIFCRLRWFIRSAPCSRLDLLNLANLCSLSVSTFISELIVVYHVFVNHESQSFIAFGMLTKSFTFHFIENSATKNAVVLQIVYSVYYPKCCIEWGRCT